MSVEWKTNDRKRIVRLQPKSTVDVRDSYRSSTGENNPIIFTGVDLVSQRALLLNDEKVLSTRINGDDVFVVTCKPGIKYFLSFSPYIFY